MCPALSFSQTTLTMFWRTKASAVPLNRILSLAVGSFYSQQEERGRRKRDSWCEETQHGNCDCIQNGRRHSVHSRTYSVTLYKLGIHTKPFLYQGNQNESFCQCVLALRIIQWRLNGGDKFTFIKQMHLKIDYSSCTTPIFVQSNALRNENAPPTATSQYRVCKKQYIKSDKVWKSRWMCNQWTLCYSIRPQEQRKH